MFDQMKKLMEMKKQADLIKKELDNTIVDVCDIKGIKITVNGSQSFKAIEIDEVLLKTGDKNKIERDILLSINAAINKSQNLATQKMKSLMPGIPGL